MSLKKSKLLSMLDGGPQPSSGDGSGHGNPGGASEQLSEMDREFLAFQVCSDTECFVQYCDICKAVTLGLLCSFVLAHCGLGGFNEILDEYFSSQLQWLMAEIPAVKLPSEERH